ncbi:hypothetical protein CVT25_012707 [Psilocybe cyanescens]|uniref:Uncharacterized protein n=1 Tax=Psilocybe cyanescens TaxID=93625 RepID=A0A409VN65_PSICY|nr:hypothetical protein CVT25_012707 [Psilocybe cyanescens]
MDPSFGVRVIIKDSLEYVKEFYFNIWKYLSDSEEEEEEKEDTEGEDPEHVLVSDLNDLHGSEFSLETLALYAEGLDRQLCSSSLRNATYDLSRSPHLRCLRIQCINKLLPSFLRGSRIQYL